LWIRGKKQKRRPQIKNIYNLPHWSQVVENVYGFKAYNIKASDDSEITLTQIKSKFFKNMLVNAPYLAYCDPIVNSEKGFHETIEKAVLLCEEKKAKYVEIRSSKSLDINWPARTDEVTFLIDLSLGVDYILKNMRRSVRQAIRKGQKNNLYYKIGTEYLDTFFDIYSKSIGRLGTPVHSYSFFNELLKDKEHFNIIVVFNDDHVPVSAGFVAEDEDTFSPLWEGGLREYNHLSHGNFLCWSLIEYACEKGKKKFDFGRSAKNSGTYDFKKRWFSQEVQLYYYYYFRKKSRVIQRKSQEYKIFTSLWKKIPISFTRKVGPILRKYIP